MSNWQRMVQVVETTACAGSAAEVFSFLRSQDDFVAGRVLAPSPSKPGWCVQAFFEDCGHDLPLPDGCRRVIVPPSLLQQCEQGSK